MTFLDLNIYFLNNCAIFSYLFRDGYIIHMYFGICILHAVQIRNDFLSTIHILYSI